MEWSPGLSIFQLKVVLVTSEWGKSLPVKNVVLKKFGGDKSKGKVISSFERLKIGCKTRS